MVEKNRLIQVELDLEDDIEKSIDKLRKKLKLGFYGNFFYHVDHANLLFNIKELRDILRRMRFALSHDMLENLFSMKEILKEKHVQLERFLLELKNQEEYQILENVLEIDEEIVLYLDLLSDGQQELNKHFVDNKGKVLKKKNQTTKEHAIEENLQNMVKS